MLFPDLHLFIFGCTGSLSALRLSLVAGGRAPLAVVPSVGRRRQAAQAHLATNKYTHLQIASWPHMVFLPTGFSEKTLSLSDE